MAERSQDWLVQARRDLEASKEMEKRGIYEWSCFTAQQVAEKAVKAVYEKSNKSVKGHSIVGLLKGLTDINVPEKLYSHARILSRYYIETRYPNGFPEGSPSDYFDKGLAQGAIDAAGQMLKWCEDTISKI